MSFLVGVEVENRERPKSVASVGRGFVVFLIERVD
jgi:hypothetical protein